MCQQYKGEAEFLKSAATPDDTKEFEGEVENAEFPHVNDGDVEPCVLLTLRMPSKTPVMAGPVAIRYLQQDK